MISAGGEQRSAMIVNSADVTDPATGQFGLTIPIDSVETLNVYQTPYLPEYGRLPRAWCRWKRAAAATSGNGN